MGIIDDYYGGYDNLAIYTDPDTGDVDYEGALMGGVPAHLALDEEDAIFFRFFHGSITADEAKRMMGRVKDTPRVQKRAIYSHGLMKKRQQRRGTRRPEAARARAVKRAAGAPARAFESIKTHYQGPKTKNTQPSSVSRRLQTRPTTTFKLRADAPAFVPRGGST